MTSAVRSIIEKLSQKHSLSKEEYALLIKERDKEAASLLRELAVAERKKIYGTDVYIRGLIEFTNRCKNNCLYCGIRRGNKSLDRYSLTADEILSCAGEGYELGFRTFVLQGGEDPYWTDERLCALVQQIKAERPDCAVTLSVGERSFESYKRLREAGADRYLLRHETASEEHYKKLHPSSMSYKNRIECLKNLRSLGYQVGAGFMVGSPFQTASDLAEDLKFIEEFSPQMCGIGPFIPHKDTPFANESAGSAELTCYLISVIRLIKPNILLPATTALGTLAPDGREQGILSGANVIMPNLTPVVDRKKYALYDNKICMGEESAQCLSCVQKRLDTIGYRTVVSRGDMIG